jgi:hypothetical protein
MSAFSTTPHPGSTTQGGAWDAGGPGNHPASAPHRLAGDGTGSLTLEGQVYELMPAFGLAHVRVRHEVPPQELIVGLNRTTPGIEFDQLRVGQTIRCEVSGPLHRVVNAKLIA